MRSVIAELPMPLWSVLLISGTLGLMIYLVADLDHPFRGHVSVGPDAFKMVYEQLMKPGK